MPYILPNRRSALEPLGDPIETPGELTFVLTRVIQKYIGWSGQSEERLSYLMITEILGALEGTKLEFYQRVVAPYEERKRKENGDVYNV